MRRRGALAVAVVLATGGCGGDGEGPAGAFELRPERPGGPVGLVGAGEGRRPLVVWGLRPESEHRVDLADDCAGRAARPVATLAANANGVAFGRVAVAPDAGRVLLVRSTAGPSAVVACGPRGELTAAEVATVGPGAAARTPAATLLQLGEDPAPRIVRARPGQEVALAVRSLRPGELRVLGVRQQVGPGAIARFSVRAPARPGRYPIVAFRRRVGTLVVDAPP